MSDLTKERIQQIWDYELISAWDEKGNNKIWKVADNFLKRVKPELAYPNSSFDAVEDYLLGLNLKRCLDIDPFYDTKVFRSWKSDVIGFVHGRSLSLSNALMDGEPKPLILIGINSYKWTKKNARASARFRQKQSYIKKTERCEVAVKARSLTKKHDWGTVK
tara:strand:+ start:407 stop:892 length:486 start_codon:yes stop_codon:yes gene_type:complete